MPPGDARKSRPRRQDGRPSRRPKTRPQRPPDVTRTITDARQFKSPARWAAGVTPAPSVHSSAKSRGRYFALGLSERLTPRKDALRIFSVWTTGCRGQPLPPTAQVILREEAAAFEGECRAGGEICFAEENYCAGDV